MSTPIAKHMIITAGLLGFFALTGTTLVALTFNQTKEKIAFNEHQSLLKALHELVPAKIHDNQLTEDVLFQSSPALLGSNEELPIYRARKNGSPVAAIISSVAPNGYNGDIRLLVAIKKDGELLGVRVVSHRETPGLGDRIEKNRSSWIERFSGYSLNNPSGLGWNVKKDGGIFDQFTGATITPRAVVNATHNSLVFFDKNKERIFKTHPNPD